MATSSLKNASRCMTYFFKLNSAVHLPITKNVPRILCARYSSKNLITSDHLDSFRKIVGRKNVLTSLASRNQYSVDESCNDPMPAEAVLIPHTTQEVSELAKLCFKSSIPMVPHGTGTGLIQGVGAVKGGVCIDLSQMTNVVEVNEADFDATVESGVTGRTLNSYLRTSGLTFTVDPGADASIGGMASTGASGTNAVRYGTMLTTVINLEVVLADGTIFYTAGKGRRARKSSAGYNLTNLFVGSEGTLGFITKVTVRLYPIPETVVAAICSFPSEESAVNSVIEILQLGIPVSRIEYVDDMSMETSKKFSNIPYMVAPTLFIEFHGQKKEVECHSKATESVTKANGCLHYEWAIDYPTRKKLWHARHELYYATHAQKPGFKSIVSDVCVPISRLTDIIVGTKKDIKDSGLFATVVGHVGDGNFHAFVMFDPKSEHDAVRNLEEKIIERALSLDGTCTGEHGIGTEKIKFLEKEMGSEGIKVMKMLKSAVDPKNLMNPGKIFV